jgi:hypothetical protein
MWSLLIDAFVNITPAGGEQWRCSREAFRGTMAMEETDMRWTRVALAVALSAGGALAATLVGDEDFFAMRRRLDRERYEAERSALVTWQRQLIPAQKNVAGRELESLRYRYRYHVQQLEEKRQLNRTREQEDADQRALERGKPRRR